MSQDRNDDSEGGGKEGKKRKEKKRTEIITLGFPVTRELSDLV